MPPDLERPIEYRLTWILTSDLELGFHGEHVDFCWRPYDERSVDARAAYRKLMDSIKREGILHPLITHRGHCLVGQRRLEIAKQWRIPGVWCYEITEDVSQWDRWDIKRLALFKERMYGSSLQQFMG